MVSLLELCACTDWTHALLHSLCLEEIPRWQLLVTDR
jgi:hypothetical protein